MALEVQRQSPARAGLQRQPVALVIGCLLALPALAAPRQQDVVPPGGFVSACAAPSTSGGSLIPGSDITAAYASGQCQSQFFAGTATASGTASSSGTNISNSSQAQATLGVVRIAAENSSPASAFFAEAAGNGGWSDRLTVNLPGLQGQSGYLLFQLSVSGSIIGTGGGASASFIATAYKNTTELSRSNPGFSPGGSDGFTTDRQRVAWGVSTFGTTVSRTVVDMVTMSVPITFGQSFVLGVYGAASAGQRSSGASPAISTATLDFMNTMTWAGVSGVLVGGVPQSLDGLTIASDSGIDWRSAVAVPEPPVAALLLGGGVLLAWARRRQAAGGSSSARNQSGIGADLPAA